MNDSPEGRPLMAAAHAAALLCGYMLLGLSILVGIEVVGRRLFGFSLRGVDELGGYALAILGALGYSYALLARAHTRIDILLSRLPGGVQAILNAVAMVALSGFALFMAWQAWRAYGETLELRAIAHSPLRTPMWIPQLPWLIGHLMFAVIAVLAALHACWLLLRDQRRLNARYGPPTLIEEIEEARPEDTPGPAGELSGREPPR